MKNLYEGGIGWEDQWDRRVWNFLFISWRVSSGVAFGPIYMPRYLPLVCEVSIFSQSMDRRRSWSEVVRGEYGMSRVFWRFK